MDIILSVVVNAKGKIEVCSFQKWVADRQRDVTMSMKQGRLLREEKAAEAAEEAAELTLPVRQKRHRKKEPAEEKAAEEKAEAEKAAEEKAAEQKAAEQSRQQSIT